MDGMSWVTLHGQGKVCTLPQELIPEGDPGCALGEFLAAIRGNRKPETHVAEHIRSLALPLAVVESSRGGDSVEMPKLIGFLD